MESLLGLNVVFFTILTVQAKEFKSSNWTIAVSTSEIFLKQLFYLQRASPSVCAGYCDNTPDCYSFSIDRSSRICQGFSSEQTLSSVNLFNMAYYQRRTNFVYEFKYHTFTTCGNSGRTGPTLSSCLLSYNADWSTNTDYFNVVNGLQVWMVPRTGHYFIQAFGAAGGLGDTSGQNQPGGKGAEISGVFFLNIGTILRIICGQKGMDAPKLSEAGGGGGGTFVYTDDKGGSGLLIAAAGGGGGGEENTRAGYDGQGGERGLNANGFTGASYIYSNGGLGYGGAGGTSETAGAGWKSNGVTIDSTECSAGQRWYGGIGNKGGDGGFGGGGSGCNSKGGGGGGGYTGAGGLSNTDNPYRGGGGGGSYNGGTNPVKITGSNQGHGFVYVQFVSE